MLWSGVGVCPHGGDGGGERTKGRDWNVVLKGGVQGGMVRLEWKKNPSPDWDLMTRCHPSTESDINSANI